ncbi:MAG: tRNA (N(6)-L-threonylcarbamoyladenosine(37)-C(2))-methylthiotransferase MtaB [Bauldia sp.]|uniref:tRNA (N(6)-L-threonylcarbamoyladenosine(37)-C(2))- methylthiotransferase MtaB n=1 Tax=Bauldia sp. TaxID=2575872 RepID=UPI001D3B897C|nr:tRNA (N(6)-L-threonylcarbamoyladenosine(37)-C(2))-methylthiotransferase MtaB [Bauldia sp.]MCB1494486.1 tRNA (N(6)-L-threonylcarbamoyladenosine(37)-C(2))-methylthiotransferase MtaB [Bauldia sp.]
MAARVITFGCRLNALESEVMRAKADAAGMEDAILVNTCAVTGEAVRQARQAIRKARRENPAASIVVSGCAAQIDPASFGGMAEVDLVLGNTEKLDAASYRLPDFGLGEMPDVRVNDIMSVTETAGHLIEGMDGRARAFVEVQNGCDHRCTFCIIPYGRGNSRSVPMGAIVDQIRRLVENGYREVVLTGVDITSYGADLPGRPKLGALARAILKHVPELERLRLSSIDSIEVDEALLAAIAEEGRLMPHLHLSLQHGDDMILKRMKRRHSRDDAIRFAEEVRRLRPDVVFGADLIAGFPTEDEAMFDNTLAIVDDCGLTHLHVFPFSPRPGTPAARMPQVDRSLVKERAARLREKGDAALAAHLRAEEGAARRVLVERRGLGRTEHFTPAEIAGGLPGEVIAARITGRTARALIAEAA